MYFKDLPAGFGQVPPQPTLLDQQNSGYNGGVESLGAPASPAPQLQNIAGTSSTAGNGVTQLQPLPPHTPPQGQMMAAGGMVTPNPVKNTIVAHGIAALNGVHPNPKAALSAYSNEFGNDAISELIRHHANGGVVHGPGSGVADLVPGTIDGREDVRIASGEYVIPAWAVAALGDGSTEQGARVLDAMVKKLRAEGSKKIMGTSPINPSKFIPQ